MRANVFDPTVATNDNYPPHTGGSTKVPTVPFLPPVGDIGTRTFVYEVPHYVYKVQPEDTLASVAKKLFGVNSKPHRDWLRRNGFETGATITINGKVPDNGQ